MAFDNADFFDLNGFASSADEYRLGRTSRLLRHGTGTVDLHLASSGYRRSRSSWMFAPGEYRFTMTLMCLPLRESQGLQ